MVKETGKHLDRSISNSRRLCLFVAIKQVWVFRQSSQAGELMMSAGICDGATTKAGNQLSSGVKF